MSAGLLPRRESKTPKPPRQPKHWTLFPAAILGLILVAVIVYLIVVPTASKDSGGITVVNAPAAPADQATQLAGPCDFPVAQNPDPTNIIPADVTWQLNGTMATPHSKLAGPLYDNGGITACYERSPSGALLAVSNMITELGNAQLDTAKLVNDKIVHSGGYDQFSLRVQDWAAYTKDHSDGLLRQIEGFRLITYSPDFVVIDVVQRGTGGPAVGRLAVQTYLLQWTDDDWKMVPPVDGDDMPVRELTSVTTPYFMFSGA